MFLCRGAEPKGFGLFLFFQKVDSTFLNGDILEPLPTRFKDSILKLEASVEETTMDPD